MAYPNINSLLHISAGGAKITMAGRLSGWTEEDLEKTRVYAYVTQTPTSDRKEPPTAVEAPPTHTATARGDEDFDHGASHWAIEAVTFGDDLVFKEGWAWATAVGVNFTAHGQLTTYNWSRWVYLTADPVELR